MHTNLCHYTSFFCAPDGPLEGEEGGGGQTSGLQGGVGGDTEGDTEGERGGEEQRGEGDHRGRMPILLNPEYSEGIPISITKKLFLNSTVLNTEQYIYCKESVTTDYKLTKREPNISCPKKV